MAKKKKRRTVKKKSRRKTGSRNPLSKLSTSQLQAELSRRASSVAVLERRRDKLLSQLADVEAKIAAAGVALTGVKGLTRRGTPRKRPQNTTNLVEALHKTLKGRTMSVTEVAEAVQKGGYKTTSPNFRTIVNQALISNKRRFKKISRGKYTAK